MTVVRMLAGLLACAARGAVAAQAQPTETGFVQVEEDVRLFYQRFGTGTPTLFVPNRHELIHAFAPLFERFDAEANDHCRLWQRVFFSVDGVDLEDMEPPTRANHCPYPSERPDALMETTFEGFFGSFGERAWRGTARSVRVPADRPRPGVGLGPAARRCRGDALSRSKPGGTSPMMTHGDLRASAGAAVGSRRGPGLRARTEPGLGVGLLPRDAGRLGRPGRGVRAALARAGRVQSSGQPSPSPARPA